MKMIQNPKWLRRAQQEPRWSEGCLGMMDLVQFRDWSLIWGGKGVDATKLEISGSKSLLATPLMTV